MIRFPLEQAYGTGATDALFAGEGHIHILVQQHLEYRLVSRDFDYFATAGQLYFEGAIVFMTDRLGGEVFAVQLVLAPAGSLGLSLHAGCTGILFNQCGIWPGRK